MWQQQRPFFVTSHSYRDQTSQTHHTAHVHFLQHRLKTIYSKKNWNPSGLFVHSPRILLRVYRCWLYGSITCCRYEPVSTCVAECARNGGYICHWGHLFIENVSLVEFIYVVSTRTPGGVTVGDSGLCCCVLCLSNAIISLCSLILHRRSRRHSVSDDNSSLLGQRVNACMRVILCWASFEI